MDKVVDLESLQVERFSTVAEDVHGDNVKGAVLGPETWF